MNSDGMRFRGGVGAGTPWVVAFAVLCLATAQPLPAQQFRAAWADVFHVGTGSQGEVNTMVSKLVAGRYNAVIVQVLAYMDSGTASHGAHWKSNILPRSTRVTASFDPLGYLCQQAHANGIEVHAWLGGSGGAMYRVSLAWPPSGNSTLAAHPEWMMVPHANSEGGAVVPFVDGSNHYYLLDMGSADAQEYLVSIVRELATNYPIDGINWDDEHGSAVYTLGLGFPAYGAATYPNSGLTRYRRNTGYVGTPGAIDATYGNYRRRFKNELIARCQAEIQSIKSNPRQPLRHTAAVMAYGGPPSTCAFTSEEAYTYYSDWPTMLQNGWLDAAIPMGYKTEANDSMYRNWCDQACACWRYSRHIYMGLGAYLNPMAYTVTQLQYAYNAGLNGAVTYSYGVPSTDAGDWWAYAAANIYTYTATVPAMPWRNPATSTEGIMWGRVRDASTGHYVDDATVTVSGRPAVQTDGNGYYIVTRIPATAGGTIYSVTAGKTGMASQTVGSATVLAVDIVRYELVLNPPVAPSGLTATAVGATQINLAWTDNATNETGSLVARSAVSGGPYTNIAQVAANTTNYADTGLSTNTTYHYIVRATNSYTTSLNSTQASATTFAPPAITSQPQSQSVMVGSHVTFTVTATGVPAPTYQWRFNGTNIAGATGTAHTQWSVQLTNAGTYSVIVSNIVAAVPSDDAVLTVTLPPRPYIDFITNLVGGGARLQISGGPGDFAIEVTPTLAGWTQLTSLTATGALFEYVDPETNQPARFYRVRLLP